jgi:hypothetical protein
MLNSRPTFQKGNNGKLRYQQGLYIPKNKDKVIKLNSQGGIWYRSSWELKILKYLDHNANIIRYGCEFISINYTRPKVIDGLLEHTEHRYFPDFYYELQRSDGGISKVLAEVKPKAETIKPVMKDKYSHKQLKNLEFSLASWNINIHKWNAAIEYCKNRGIEFVIITEDFINNLT